MPELPEVEVVRIGLRRWMSQTVVRGVEVSHPRAVRRHEAGPRDFERQLTGCAIGDVRRRGKFLWWPMADDRALVAHLGMSGQFRVDAAPGQHTRVAFHLDAATVLFDDQRTFGGMWIDPAPSGLPAALAHIAPDPFSDEYDRATVARRIRSRRAPVKALLLDQSVVSGIGNIYADEALWEAKVHWATPGDQLSARKVALLLDAAQAVMTRAVEVGGTSFDSLYVNVNGSSGYFQRDLNAYGQQGLPCPRCGAAIVRERFANRSSHRCPRCQRRRTVGP